MLMCSTISAGYLPDMQRIEQSSNPFPWQAQSICNAFQQFQHLGGFCDAQLVTFVLYRVVADEAEVIHLVCDVSHQGKGYAQSLMATLIQQLTHQGVAHLFLEVRANNTIAKRLYQRLGFVDIGCRKDYYGAGQDALTLRLVLSP